MTKKELHKELRNLKKEFLYINSFQEFITVTLKGREITNELYERGCSMTDLKVILNWEKTKEIVRDYFMKKLAA